MITLWQPSIRMIQTWMFIGGQINCSRPLPEWEEETPQEIRTAERKPKPGWVHWFFSFVHNLGLPKEKIDKIIANTPKGTKIWKNKILGLRGKATGLVFSNFDRVHHVKSKEWAKQFIQHPDEPEKRNFSCIFRLLLIRLTPRNLRIQ